MGAKRARERLRTINANYDSAFFSLPVPSKKYDPRHGGGFESLQVAVERKAELVEPRGGGNARPVDWQRSCADVARAIDAGRPHVQFCIRSFRIRWAGIVAREIFERDLPWSLVTIIPPDLTFSLGKLHNFKPWRLKDRIRKQLERTKISNALVLGGIDLGVENVGIADRQRKWRPHLHFFVCGPDRKSTRDALRRFYPKRKRRRTKRPLHTADVDRTTAVAVATYAFKSVFDVRTATKDVRGNADTIKTWLKPGHWRELAPLLDAWGFTSRFFRRGS